MKCLDGSSDVKVYNLTAAKSMPEWLNTKKKKKKVKRDDDDLLQDFEMPDVSNCMRLSKDGQYLIVSGTYKPVMKCYDLSELSVKVERGMDAEVVAFEIITDDFSKIAYLQEGRYVEFHGQCGRVCRLRVPRYGRDLAHHYPSADLYIAASGSDIYRFNLFQGRFLNSLDAQSKGVNKIVFNEQHWLLMGGTDDGLVKSWDPRSRRKVGEVDCGKHMMEHSANSFEEELRSCKNLRVSSLAYDGLFTLAVGNQNGQVLMYDIRWNTPYLVRDHYTRSPINSLHFHSSGNVFSMAPSVVKIWDKNTGDLVTSIEGEAPFNDMAVMPGTGLAFFAAEDKRMKAYFVPSLGPAPTWCSHLDSMTGEMEDDDITNVASQFDDYTFVTMDDLIELGLKDLVGSGMLRAAMHGYYIKTDVYNKARQLVKPVKPQNVLKRKLKDTIAQENTTKLIDNSKSEVLVNQDLLDDVEPADAKDLMDERFAKLFTDNKFKRDPEVQKKLRKSAKGNKKQQEAFKKRQAEIAREEEEFRQAKMSAEATAQGSDEDSMDGSAEGGRSSSEDSEDQEEREEQRRKMFRRRSGGGGHRDRRR